MLRVSLAHWWRPEDKPEGELRCYVQLSGWFQQEAGNYWPGWDLEPALEADAQPEPSVKRAASNMPADMSTAQFNLENIFGFDDFLPLQAEVIDNIIKKNDSLAIMPTGSGKSLCYQLPALMFEGLTVVVSPLISLMQDQVDQLRQLQIPAVFLTNSVPRASIRSLPGRRSSAVEQLIRNQQVCGSIPHAGSNVFNKLLSSTNNPIFFML